MAYFCPVAPLPVLEGFLANSALGRQHLLLAHDIVKPQNRIRYGQIFANMLGSAETKFQSFDSKRLIILDNSVIELGNSVNLDIIMDAADIVKPTCAVLPDVMLDPDATIISCKKAIDPWWDAFQKTWVHGHHPRLMYVPQGKTLGDFARCAEAMVEDDRIGFWGIPRNLVAFHSSRRDAIQVCIALNPKRKIHMLGFSDNNVDDLICSQIPDVTSIDSAVPIRMPGKYSVTADVGPRGDWWDTASYNPQMLENLRIARELFAGKSNVRRFD